MNGRIDPERIPYLNRECHRIFAQYDPDPDHATYQHAKILELMAADGAEDQEEEEGSPSGET